jgi:protein-tyrosine phosphatase
MAYEYALNQIESGNSVLVHCRHGKDRTGLFMAYFLRQQLGLSTVDAIERVKTVRPIALTAEGWEDFAIELLESCRIPD